jgi:hypothetical protein
VVSLLHRADWTRLSLSGEVSGNDQSRTPVVAFVETVRPLPPGPSPVPLSGLGDPAPGDTQRAWALRVAPGGRYRRESGPCAFGSDGARAWQWYQDMGPDAQDLHVAGTVPPFPTLLCPSWLLTRYELSVMGPVSACGRDGIRVTGTARPRLDSNYARVDAVVDAELGILLRCERVPDGASAADLLEFASLEVSPQTHDAVFAPPPGSHVHEAKDASRVPVADEPSFAPAFPLPDSPAARTAVGLAARTLMKFTPFIKVRVRPEDVTGEQMPDDDPPPGAGDPEDGVSDEILLLLYRSGASVPRFSATLHTWTNAAAVLAGTPESLRQTGHGGVGYLVDAVAAQSDVTTHEVSAARIDGWYRYLIERVPPLEERRHSGPTLIACNRRRYWEVREDRVGIDEPRPAPAELADLADASWLLGCELSGGEAITAAGRPAYRLTVRGDRSQSELLDLGFPAVAVVDAETGRLLRLTTYGDGKPGLRHELRDVSEAAPDDDWNFAFDAPRGLRVVRIGADDDRPLRDSGPDKAFRARKRTGGR